MKRDLRVRLAAGASLTTMTVAGAALGKSKAASRKLRQGRPRPSARWYLDEMVVRIAGKQMYLWRAVDHEGEVLDIAELDGDGGVAGDPVPAFQHFRADHQHPARAETNNPT